LKRSVHKGRGAKREQPPPWISKIYGFREFQSPTGAKSPPWKERKNLSPLDNLFTPFKP